MSTPPPPIGSAAWDTELASQGVRRAEANDLLARALQGRDTCGSAGHDVDLSLLLDQDMDAERRGLLLGAAWVLLHERAPRYGLLMYFRMEAWPRPSLATPRGLWCVRQLAAMLIHGPAEVRASAEYLLWVDPFEVAEESRVVFPALARFLPRRQHPWLLSVSGGVAWEAKPAFYERHLSSRRGRERLGDALVASAESGFLCSIGVGPARSLLARLPELGPEKRARVVAGITPPVRALLVAAASVDDPELAGRYRGAHFAALGLRTPLQNWVWPSEARRRGQVLGRYVHFRWALRDPAPPYGLGAAPRRHRELARLPDEEFARPLEWHIIEADLDALEAALGDEIELWPQSLLSTAADDPTCSDPVGVQRPVQGWRPVTTAPVVTPPAVTDDFHGKQRSTSVSAQPPMGGATIGAAESQGAACVNPPPPM